MIISEHSGRTLAHQAGTFEPQRTSNFAIVISGLSDTEKLILTTKSFKIPGTVMSQQSIKYFNETVHYAGAVEPFSDGTLSLRDYLDVDTISVLSNWYRQVYNPENGAIGWARDYKKTAEVFLLPPGMQGNTPGAVSSTAYNNRIWKMTGVWPKGLEYPDLDHDTPGENAIVSLTLSIDKAVPVQMGRIS